MQGSVATHVPRQGQTVKTAQYSGFQGVGDNEAFSVVLLIRAFPQNVVFINQVAMGRALRVVQKVPNNFRYPCVGMLKLGEPGEVVGILIGISEVSGVFVKIGWIMRREELSIVTGSVRMGVMVRSG